MRHFTLIASFALLASVASPAAAEEVRTFTENFEAAAVKELYVDFPIGELSVEGTASERIMVEVKIECSRSSSLDACIDRAADVSLDSRERGDQLALTIEGFSRWRSRGMHIEMKVLVPHALDVRVDMSIGELDLADLFGDVRVDMSIGEVSFRSSEEMVGRISLDTGIGESSLVTTRGRRNSSGLFTREIAWTEGNGESEIQIELGIGEVSVRLR
jgi:hypothetical protein